MLQCRDASKAQRLLNTVSNQIPFWFGILQFSTGKKKSQLLPSTKRKRAVGMNHK